MSFVTKENTKSGQTNLGAILIHPSQGEWSDIEELANLNRGANEPKENLDELMKSIRARGGYVTPAKGYLENKRVKFTAGSRRLAAGQALEAQGELFPIPVVLIKKPETPEEIAAALLDSAVDNNFRKEDSAVVLHRSFDTLRQLGYSYTDIGEATGFSHQKAYNLLKSFEIKPLKEAIIKGEISDRAAAEFLTENYKKIDPKTSKPAFTVEEKNGKKVKVPVYDEEKIANELKKAKAAANGSGKGKVSTGIVKNTQTDKIPAPGMKAVRVILDEPEDNVPSMFKKFAQWLNGELELDNFKKIAKKNGYLEEIEWLFDIEFDSDKRKAAKDAEKAKAAQAKANKATKAKKDNPLVEEDSEETAEEDFE